MRTNIDLDEQLLEEAFKHAGVKTKKALIHLALQEFVANRNRKDIRELRGKITFAKGYDYKNLRRDDSP